MKFLIIALTVIGVLLLFFIAYLLMISPSYRAREKMKKYKNAYFAHRGLHNERFAENSLGAFKNAVKFGYGIELDVRLSADGELVVFHDSTANRVTGVDAKIKELKTEELKSLSLSGTGEGVPTFAEVLEAVDGKVPLLIEIKEESGEKDVTPKLAEALKGYQGEYIIESFNPLSVRNIKKLLPGAVCGILSFNYHTQKEYRKPMYLMLELLLLNSVARPDFIAFRHEDSKNAALRLSKFFFGAPTLAWTVRSEEEETRAKKNGFEGIIFEGYLPKNN